MENKDKCTAIVPQGEIKDDTPKYRNLSDDEQEELFYVYTKHNGNASAMTRDVECKFNSRNQITYYNKVYGYLSKLAHIRAENIKRYMKTHNELLNSAKAELLNQAIILMSDRMVDKVTANGTLVTIQISPSSMDLLTAWKIIKTELGEPTTITKNENMNKDADKIADTKNLLLDLINNVKTKTAKTK